MDIAPDKQNIDGIFSNTVYYIDFYQRDYKWTEEPVTRLLDDIFYKFNQEYALRKDLAPSKETIIARYPWYYRIPTSPTRSTARCISWTDNSASPR